MYDYVLLFNIITLIFTVLLGYYYIIKIVPIYQSYHSHLLVSYGVLFATWLMTIISWYFTTVSSSPLIFVSGSLVTIVSTLFCGMILLASVLTNKNYKEKRS